MRALIAGSIQGGQLRWVVFHAPTTADEIDAFCEAIDPGSSLDSEAAA